MQGVYVQYVRGGECHEHACMQVTNICGISSACVRVKEVVVKRSWASFEILVSAQIKVYTNSEAFEHSTPSLRAIPVALCQQQFFRFCYFLL